MKDLRVFAVIAIASLLTVGCDAKKEDTPAAAPKAPETKKEATPPASNVSVGGTTATTGAVPADFPKDITIYKDATVAAAASNPSGYAASLQTADAPEAVAAFYKDDLAKQGWTGVQAMAAAGAHTLTGTKDKRRVSVGISKDPTGSGKTMIGITITANP